MAYDFSADGLDRVQWASGDINPSGDFTLFAYIRTSTSSPTFPNTDFGRMVSNYSGGNGIDLLTENGGATSAHFAVGLTGGSGTDHATGTTDIWDQSWHCLCCTWEDGVEAKIYIDDMDTAEDTGSHTGSYDASTVGGVVVGGQWNGLNNYAFPGTIAEVALFDALLSAGERWTVKHRTAMACSRSLLLYWPLLNSGVDWSGSAQNGTVTAATVTDHPPVVRPGLVGWAGAYTAATKMPRIMHQYRRLRA